MPGQPLDNESTREWRRQLERGRLDGLAVGDDLPGPGAAAAVRRPSSRPATDEPRDWRIELERDRLSMLAMDQGTDLPGPGAAGAKEKEGKYDKGTAQLQALVGTIVQKALPALVARGRIYMTALATFIVPNLIYLHFHKLMKDGVIRDAAVNLKSAARQIKVPLPPQARLLIWAGPILPTAEWLLVLFLDLVLLALLILLVALLGFFACALNTDCVTKMGTEVFGVVKDLL